MTITQYIELIRLEQSSNAKKAIYLRAKEEHPHIAEIFNAAYNPQITYGVTLSSIPTRVPPVGPLLSLDRPEGWDVVSVLLTQLSIRELSGGSAQMAIMDVLIHFCHADQQVICCILDRDMHCGFTAGFSTNVFQVALANKYDPKKHKLNTGWMLSRKLDGVRCIAKVGNCEVQFFSRTGRVFTTLKNLELDILQRFEAGTVLDGEVCLVNSNGKEDFIGIVSEIKRKDWTIANPKYYIFDMLEYQDFASGASEDSLLERLGNLNAALLGTYGHITALEQRTCTDDCLLGMQKQAMEEGWEGVMARKDVPYKAGRSSDLLKIKEFHDDEYTVVGAEVGCMDIQGVRSTDLLLSVHILHKGYEVSVGSGFSLAQRRLWGSDTSLIVGKTITVKYFEESKNAGGGISLRFPTFKCLHGDKREV